MCGFAGKLILDSDTGLDRSVLSRMTDAIGHRGPDDAGVWANGRIGLGSRRLAVLDLTAQGHQPMTNEDGSIHLVFNGEIYNFHELRRELEHKGHVFRSHTDTETIIHLYEEKGLEALDRLHGMFAFALWDDRKQTLLLARDRLGKKPLFYHDDGRALVFASEVKAILQDPDVVAEPDPQALHLYLTYGYIPAPWSAFRRVRKLPPAHYLVVRDARSTLGSYWKVSFATKRSESEGALAEQLLDLLSEATRVRLRSDVPFGVLLSGGLDSSTVLAMMRQHVSGPIKTFSIGFEDPEYDELAYARDVARRFETDHAELVVRPDALGLLPHLVWHYDEPFADSSAIATLAVSRLARSSVTVALCGDGGDESFLGYDRYVAERLATRCEWIPKPVRRLIAASSRAWPESPPKSARHRVRRFAEALPLDRVARYARWVTAFSASEKAGLYTGEFSATVGGTDALQPLETAVERFDGRSPVERVAYADIATYLPGDLLVKTDIASMAHSLEVRSPFLDHHVVEFAAALPPGLKLRGTTQKYLLRKCMKHQLPASVLTRRKMGFGVPIDRWFRKELKDFARDVLLDRRATARGYFRPEVVRHYLNEHVQGIRHHHFRLWSLLMLELWHRQFIDQSHPSVPPGASSDFRQVIPQIEIEPGSHS